MGIIKAFWDEDIFLSQDNYLENNDMTDEAITAVGHCVVSS